MVDREKLVDMIINTDLEKVPGPKDVWEKHVYLDDDKVLIVGYEETGKICQGLTADLTSGGDEEKCAISYTWYWEVRDSESWDVLYENHDEITPFVSSARSIYDPCCRSRRDENHNDTGI